MKGIVFDRDGTIIYNKHYLSDPEQVVLLPHVKDVLTKLKKMKYQIFLHTNQSGVERGYFDLEQVHKCNKRMISLLGKNFFTEICIATDIVSNEKNYRKPSKKFGLEIIERYNLNKLIYVGDSPCDLETAYKLNCDAIGLNIDGNRLSLNNSFSYPIISSYLNIFNLL